MQVSQSAEAKIPPPRSPPLPLTTAERCSAVLASLSHCFRRLTKSVQARVSVEQVEHLTGILQSPRLTFSKAGVMLLSFIDI